MVARLPDFMCPWAGCDGSGWSVDERTRLATRCQCMDERIRLRDETAKRRSAVTAPAARDKEEAVW